MNFIQKIKHNTPIIPPYNNYILLTVVGILILSIVLTVTLTLSSQDVRSRANQGNLIVCDTNLRATTSAELSPVPTTTSERESRRDQLRAELSQRKEELKQRARDLRYDARSRRDELKAKLQERKKMLRELARTDARAAIELIKSENIGKELNLPTQNCFESEKTITGSVAIVTGDAESSQGIIASEKAVVIQRDNDSTVLHGFSDTSSLVGVEKLTVSGYEIDGEMIVNPENVQVTEKNPNVLQATDGVQVATWRTLVMVYRNTDASYGNGRLTASMTQSQVDTAVTTVRRLPGTLSTQSNGLAKMQMDIVYPTNPIRTLRPLFGGYWVDPVDISGDIRAYGKYDSVIVIWKDINGQCQIVHCGWSYGMAPVSSANGASYALVPVPSNNVWGGTYPDERFVHEWLHGSLGYFVNLGYRIPNLDEDPPKYGYSPDGSSWMRWYSDLMKNNITTSTGGKTGVPREAWKKTPTGGTLSTVSPIVTKVPSATPRPASTTAPVVGQGSGADLVVTSLRLTDSVGTVKTSFRVGERIYVKVTLKNQGTSVGMSSVDTTYSQIYSNKPSTVALNTVSDKTISLKNGEFGVGYYRTYNSYVGSSTLTFFPQSKSWTVSTPGTYTARAFIDYNNTVKETNEGNNQRTTTYTITN